MANRTDNNSLLFSNTLTELVLILFFLLLLLVVQFVGDRGELEAKSSGSRGRGGRVE